MRGRKLGKTVATVALGCGVLATLPAIANAHHLTQSNTTVDCQEYHATIGAQSVNVGDQICSTITATCSGTGGSGTQTFMKCKDITAFFENLTLDISGSWTLSGTCSFSGSVDLTVPGETGSSVLTTFTPTTLTCGQPQTPGINLVKTPSNSTPAPGEPVTYTYTVTNTGGVTLNNVSVTDDNGTPLVSGDDFTFSTIPTLLPGASQTLTRTTVPSNVAIVPRLGGTATGGAAFPGSPSGFAVLSLGGDASHPNAGINCSLATVNGNLGIPNYGKFNNMAPCIENGNFYKGSLVTYTGPGKLKGQTIVNDALLNMLRTEAFDAATFFAGLNASNANVIPATALNNGNISGSITLTGKAGFNVVNLPKLTLNGTLTLAGPAGTQFVFNINGPFDLHSGKIVAATGSGIGSFDVVYNITNPSASVKTMVPTTAIGVLLAPYNAINAMDSSYFYGEIIGGYNKVITLMSGTRVVPPQPPPPTVTNTATATATATSPSGPVTVSSTAKATVTVQ